MIEKSVTDQLVGLATSPYIWAALIAYLGGQTLKIILRDVREKLNVITAEKL